MKKIINWSFGSFFRTIGRFVAYFVILTIIFIVGSFLGSKISFFNFFMKVSAETYDAINIDNFSGNNMCVTDSYSAAGCSAASRSIPFFYSYEIVSNNFSMLFFFNSEQKEYPLPSNASYTIIPVYLKTNEDFTFVSNYNDSEHKLITSNIINFNLSIWNTTSSGSKWFTCDLLQHDDKSNYYYYRCPVQGNIHSIRTSVNFITADNNVLQSIPTVRVGIGELWSLATDNSSSVETALNEAKQNTEDIKNSINNDDINGATDTSSSFFNNFDDGDTGSLMNLVKLPLKFLNSLNNTCKPITFNTGYLGNMTIPCLSTTFYNQDGLKPIVNIVSLIINGLIMYGCINTIIKLVYKLKDPNNDEIEVMEL